MNTTDEAATIPQVIYLKKSNGKDFPASYMSDYHTHLLCHRGEIQFVFNGEKQVCTNGEFVFWLAENTSVKAVVVSSDFESTAIFINKDLMYDNVPDQSWGIDAVLHSRKYPVKHLHDAKEQQRILSNFERLYRQYQDFHHRFYTEALQLQVRLFILEMWHIFANDYERRKRTIQSGTLYERFIDLVVNNCMKEREVQFYANQLHVSPNHLNAICKQNSDVTASEWIKRYTKEGLIILLQNKNLNIAEIADEMNFSSRSFFTTYVKKLLGVTPSTYRNRLR